MNQQNAESKLEQAADEYAKKIKFSWTHDYNGFIAGAKSEAAKEYWQSLTTPASTVGEGQTQEPVGGMKWVKASDRLPEINKVVYINRGGGKNIGHWDGKDFWPHLNWVDDNNGADLETIQWLDENFTPPPAPIKTEGKDERTEYYYQLTKNLGKTQPYHYIGPKCVPQCENFPHYETKHHKDCPFYKNSLSEKYDKIAPPSPVEPQTE